MDHFELYLSTVSKKLYNTTDNKWVWNEKPLLWHVQCLNINQKTVSEMVAPSISKELYQMINTNPPVQWDFSLSQSCKHSNNLLVIFTFNPESVDLNDYVFFIVNPDCDIVFSSKNKQLQDYTLNLEATKMGRFPYLELWLNTNNDTTENFTVQAKTNTSNCFIIFLISLVIICLIFFLMLCV